MKASHDSTPPDDAPRQEPDDTAPCSEQDRLARQFDASLQVVIEAMRRLCAGDNPPSPR